MYATGGKTILENTHKILLNFCSARAASLREVFSNSFSAHTKSSRGVTLLDTVVGTALMLVIFMGIAAAFELSLDVVSTNKARGGAIALADERMEYVRSLPYTSVGTVGGIPSGSIAQSETLTLNNVSYTRRTVVEYVDDPKDGTGGADADGVADYKAVKVDVAWSSRFGTRHITLVTRLEPQNGVESAVPGGTLTINVVNAVSQPLAGASVAITNSNTSPAINISTFTNSNGIASFIGAPAASGYAVIASESGYSTAQTYSGTNPTPGSLTVSNNQTTSQTFQIDLLSSDAISTRAWSDNSPITSVQFSMHGVKTTSSNPVTYKYNATLGGGGAPTTTVSSLEYDTYTMAVAGGSGYDIASSCPPQPVYLAPNTIATTTLFLAPHTTNSLPVKVTSNATSALIPGASVRLYKTGYNTTQSTDSCGQTFFSGLSSGPYSVDVSASGYTTRNNLSVSVSGTTAVYSIALN